MARLIIPEHFTPQKKLLEAIEAEHIDQGSDSVIQGYLVQNKIDLTSHIAIANTAQNLDDSRSSLEKQSTNYTQLRDLKFNPVIVNFKNEVQFLKSMNKNNPKFLGDWSITVTGNNRIYYPTNFTELAKVASNFFDKHLSFAADTSPLHTYIIKKNINVQTDRDDIDAAITLNDKSAQTAKDSENGTEQRNLIWNPIMKDIRGIGNFLMKLYPDNPRALGAFGYTVDSAVTKPKLQTTKIKLGAKTTLKGIKIGTTLSNIGTSEIYLHKGKGVSDNPIIIPAGESYGIIKGYSTVTISNPSKTNEAKVNTFKVK
jgi:hypothetical protein